MNKMNWSNKLDKELNTNLSKEQLDNEIQAFAQASAEMLQKSQKEQAKKLLTNPSAIALSQTAHSADNADIRKVKKSVNQLFILYLTNQFVARSVNVRADTLISRGYELVGDDKKGIDACTDLIEKSGGINLFWQLGINCDIAGDGFLEKVYNKNKTKILKLKHVHPLTLSFRKDKFDRIVVDENKDPVGYEQYYLDENGVEQAKDVSKEVIEHLRFNVLGDEFTGLSIIQSGYDTIVRLMNMEYAAAEAAVKIANPIIIAKCNTKSPHQIAMWGQILGNISGRDQLFVPEGMELDTLQPGQQNFSEYASYFLNAVVAASGVPKGVLLGDTGGSGNRAEGVVLTRHFYSLIASNQKYMQDFFKKIFEEYAEIGKFKAPNLVFPDIAEDVAANAESAIELWDSGIIDLNEAREMIGLKATKNNQFKTFMSTEASVRASDMKAWHPSKPGSKEGSQKNEKKQQKKSPFSEFKGDGKKNV